MTFHIRSIATATPKYQIEQSQAASIAKSICCETDRHRRLLPQLYKRAGVNHRCSVLLEPIGATPTQPVPVVASPKVSEQLPHEDITQSFFEPAQHADDCGPSTAQRMQMYERYAPELAADAVTRALSSCCWDAAEITHLITVSCTGFSSPGVDHSLVHRCGLNPAVQRTNIGFMGCHGAINGLRLAKAFADADPKSRILLCAVELCTLHQQYGWHPDRIVSNSLFADGAAAVLGSGEGGGASLPQVRSTGSLIVEDTKDLMTWHVRDNGFEMSLSTQVPQAIKSSLLPWLEQWLGNLDLSIADVNSWAVHPGGPRILSAVEQTLGAQDGALHESRRVLAEYGNMSSPTVLFILQRLLQRAGQATPCVMLAFGPGLTVEVALVV